MLLADSSRPLNLNDFVGQKHLVGPDGPIRKMLEAKQIFPMIFWGPPGTGKTTLARIIAKSVGAGYHELSAVSAGKSDIKRIVDSVIARSPDHQVVDDVAILKTQARSPHPSTDSGLAMTKTILFLDEIHRFNKAQQDYLLPFVEHGTLTLIGATTENPSFEVISPLLSRCRTYVFYGLTEEDLKKIINRVLAMKQFSAKGRSASGGNNLTIEQEALNLLVSYSNGDGRTALNVIDLAKKLFPKKKLLSKDDLAMVIQDKRLRYDTTGEEHYNTISAFIKSMRASNVDSALYYLARMVEAGEDPLFIARRMVIFASEDIGMAQPTALVVANEVFRACETIGYPECAINLAHGVTYLSLAKKDRASYNAYFAALSDVKQFGNLPIPLNLRNAPTKLMKDLGYGKGYDLPASATPQALQAGKYSKESLLPDELKDKKYYLPMSK